MSLRTKILIILLAVVALYAGLDYGIQRFVVFPSFAALEREEAIKNMERCVEALHREVHHLDAFVHDWAAWDDTYEFVIDGNEEYMKSNLVPVVFTDNSLNLISIYNLDGEAVWSEAFDLETEEQMQIKEFSSDSLPVSHPLLAHHDVHSSIAGIFLTNGGPMLIASNPVVTSDNEGPPRGSILMGRFLDDTVIDMIAEQTRVSLRLWPIQEQRLPADEKDFVNEITEDSPFLVSEVDGNTLQVRTIFRDIEGKPALLMLADIPRDITARGTVAMRYAMLSILIAGLAILFVLVFLLKLTVINPLSKLTEYATAIGKSDDLSARIEVRHEDEIGALAREFNNMVERLAEARQRLLDQSYYSGMAELASGVLHNIRNSLSPITGYLNDLSSSLRKCPVEKIEIAHRELSEDNPAPERKEDLTHYIELATKKLVSSVKEMNGKVEAMSEETMKIEEILADQDKVSRAERVILPIDLEKVISDSIRLMSAESVKEISIETAPDISKVPEVMAQRVVLLHVFNSLFANAVESIRRAGVTAGKISISAGTEQKNGSAVVHIQIRDNGAGIDESNLERIFERGFTTKQTHSSGFGLHGCANTVVSMNGRIFAENIEDGHGARMHLVIPAKPSTP